ncbi:hypothetical protein STVIR_7698 [Streptomyces viridochromogenes Tue57]|uniref:Uncharacterized protein n=1 Tax=Streptomyces viridochromogenes Tue57 TaxID=1160705 RepID=L8P7R8_STRVR|nr:hypothetical protein STVIR_7698 [Streptomyces viridochromogenes Tue57]
MRNDTLDELRVRSGWRKRHEGPGRNTATVFRRSHPNGPAVRGLRPELVIAPCRWARADLYRTEAFAAAVAAV